MLKKPGGLRRVIGVGGFQHFFFLKILFPLKSQTKSNPASTSTQASASVLATLETYSSWSLKSSSPSDVLRRQTPCSVAGLGVTHEEREIGSP